MKLKQKTIILTSWLLTALTLALIPSSGVFALTKQEFVDVLCSSQQGPATGGMTLAEKCKKDGKETGKVTIAGKVFKLSDYRDLSKSEFQRKAEQKLGLEAGALGEPQPADPNPANPGAAGCAGVETSIIKCDADNSGDLENNGVWALLLLVINILTAGVGIVAVGGIVYGAILYTSAGDKADQVKKAIGVITNVVIGVVAYFAMFALLQFIIPGGIFK